MSLTLFQYSNQEFENYFKNCKADEKKCDNGNCYWEKYHCDGDKDCTDGSDEKNCPAKKVRGRACVRVCEFVRYFSELKTDLPYCSFATCNSSS